jgi:hypothetical protein
VNLNSISRSRTSSASSPLSSHIPCGRSSVGSGRSMGRLVRVSRAILKSWRLAPSTHGEADRHAAAVGEDAPLGPELPTIGRVLAHLFPPEWGVGHRPVHRQPRPVNPLQRVIGCEPALSQRQQHSSLGPLVEAAMGGTTRTNTPCGSGRSTDTPSARQSRWHPWPGGHRRGPVASQWVRLPWREEGYTARPQFVGHAPITADFFRGTHVRSSYGREGLPLGYH